MLLGQRGSNSPWKMRWCFESTSSLIRTLQTFQTCLSEKAKGRIDHQSLEQVNKNNLEKFNWNFKITTWLRLPLHCVRSKYHKPPKGSGTMDKITHWIVYVFFSERLLVLSLMSYHHTHSGGGGEIRFCLHSYKSSPPLHTHVPTCQLPALGAR